LAMLIGSGIVAKLPTEGLVEVPVLGAIFPWQLIFLYIGLPGVAVALLLLTVREPARTNTLKREGETVQPNLGESLRLVFKHPKVYLLVCFATAFQALVNYGCNAWMPTFVARTYGWEVPRAGAFYGMVVVVASITGALFGGWYADRLVKQGVADGRLRLGVFAGIGCLAAVFLPLLPRPEWALLAYFIPCFSLAAPYGAATAAIQEIMPNQVRALASSIFLFILNLIGIGLGPTSVALFTDYVFQDEQAIRYSLVLLFALAGVSMLVLSYLALKPYRTVISEQLTTSSDQQSMLMTNRNAGPNQ
jgi:MFS family permease